MKNNFSLIKIILITILMFVVLDVLIGKYIYKTFIRKNYRDIDRSYVIADPVYHHKFKPNYKGVVGWGNINYDFCTDENGFRASCKDTSNKAKKFDIGFIGDSYTEGVGDIYEKSFVGIIASELKDKKIANLAVQSYSTSIYYAKINSLLSKGYKFNEIIVFIDLGDIVDDILCYKLENDIIRTRNTFEKCFAEPSSIRNKVKNFTKNRLSLSYEFFHQIKYKLIDFGILKYSGREININNRRSSWTYAFDEKEYNNYTYDELVENMLVNMQKLSNLLRKNEIELSIALYPWPATLKNDTRDNKYLKIWQNFCITNCKNLFNLMEPFFDFMESEGFSKVFRKYYIFEDEHFNSEGHKVIAAKFLEKY